MKKLIPLLLLASILAFSAPGLAKDRKDVSPKGSPAQPAKAPQEIDLNKDNPIDQAFTKDFEMAQATPEINYVSEAYLEAWKAEMANVANTVKKSFTNKEDGKRVDDYVADYESLVKKAFDLEMLNWISDPEEAIASRSFGTGAGGGAMTAQGRMYKQATLNLVAHYQANPDLKYVFAYKGQGADLDKLRGKEK